MKRNPQVIAFMKPFPYPIDLDAPLEDAHKLMREHHLPVTSGGAIVGVLSDRDITLVLGSDFGSPDERVLVGIFTVTDVCRALAQVLGEHGEETNSVARPRSRLSR